RRAGGGGVGAAFCAGATLASYAIPNAIAYAMLAGLPSQAGLYGYIACGVAYAVFGTSRQLAVGPTTAISLSVASGLAVLAADDPERYARLAATIAVRSEEHTAGLQSPDHLLCTP